MTLITLIKPQNHRGAVFLEKEERGKSKSKISVRLRPAIAGWMKKLAPQFIAVIATPNKDRKNRFNGFKMTVS